MTIGKSGKREVSNVDDLVGHFGIGALSMFLISDSIFVQTKKSGDSPISFRMYTDLLNQVKKFSLRIPHDIMKMIHIHLFGWN